MADQETRQIVSCDWGRNFQIFDAPCPEVAVKSVVIDAAGVEFDHKFCRPHFNRAELLANKTGPDDICTCGHTRSSHEPLRDEMNGPPTAWRCTVSDGCRDFRLLMPAAIANHGDDREY